MMQAVWLDPTDNVATVLKAVTKGEIVHLASGEATATVAVQEAVPFGHKLAVRPIATGEPIIKYGEVIGRASGPIAAGQYVHLHNVKSCRGGQSS